MPVSSRRLISNMLRDLKTERDELGLQIHLGKLETKQKWEALQKKLDELTDRFEPLKDAVEQSSEDILEALKLLGSEIKEGFQSIRKSL